MKVAAVFLADDGQYLEQALSALRCQTKPVSYIFVVDLTAKRRSQETLSTFASDGIMRFPPGYNRARALNAACLKCPDTDFYWFLNTRIVAAPTALEYLLNTIEVSPGASIAAPKILNDTGVFFDYGQSITTGGRAVHLVQDELDQGQHDDKVDTMGANYAGMLVHRSCFEAIKGFDPGFSEYEQGLDFCIRARLSGARVSLSPRSVVTHVGTGLRSYRVQEGYIQKRTGQLRRQIVYAPFVKSVLLWFSLIPRGVLWFLASLLTRRSALKEAWAHIKLAFLPISLARSRKISNRQNSLRALSVLMQKPKREFMSYEKLDFFFRNGLVIVLIFVFIGFVVFLPFLAHPALSGGSLLPINLSFYQMWRMTAVYVFLDGVYPADPFNIIPALLGSLTFWDTNFSILLLYFVALPLSCTAAWLCASRLLSSPRTIAFSAALYSLSPSLWLGLYNGNLQGIVVHICLPFLCFLMLGIKTFRTLSLASLLFAFITVASPSIFLPLTVLVLIVAIATATFRMLFIVLPVIVAFIPLFLVQPLRVNLLADPVLSSTNLFSSIFGLGNIFTTAHLSLFLLVLPIIFLILMGLWKTYSSLPFLLITFVGFVNSVIWADVWQGPSFSLAWLGITGAAAIGFTSIRCIKRMIALVSVGALGAFFVYIPYATKIWQAQSPVVSTTSAVNLPAYVLAEANSNSNIGTLIVEPVSEKEIRVKVARGAVFGFGSQNTKLISGANPQSSDLANLAVNLVMSGNVDIAEGMKRLNLEMLLLSGDKYGFSANINANSMFEAAGNTPFGKLWRLKDRLPPLGQATFPPYYWLSPIVFLLLFLVGVFGRSSRKPPEEMGIDLEDQFAEPGYALT
ncbi:glycosyltransferase family 2 protein [Tropheryma whipplei]|uniref:glycosyltransferase family 2 protein n=1 Tax=Tropheryma whipplei TaxID=2039 RepID=UPI0004BBA43C|nr:hypothetical protein [Tropheryma whipplei]